MTEKNRYVRQRRDVADVIARRRDKQSQHEELWKGTCKYFDRFSRCNQKYEEWTSPRYYEENTKMIEDIKLKKEKKTRLESRRAKLSALLKQEEESYQVELMVFKAKKSQETTTLDTSTQVLKEFNSDMKSRVRERKKYEAEMKLFQQWRNNNPIIRQYESKFRHKDLKLSWLDQQIEKRMQKEREEEENQRLLKEHEEQLKKEQEEQRIFEQYVQEKREQLKSSLNRQVEEINQRKKREEELANLEYEEMCRKKTLEEIEESLKLEMKRRKEREIALFNVRQYKTKLKLAASEIQTNLKQDQILALQLKQLQLDEIVSQQQQRQQIQQEISKLYACIEQHKNLQKQREKYQEFLFDSETKAVYEQQSEQWRQEEQARRNLAEQVLRTLKEQIEEKLLSNRKKREEIVKEREELLRKSQEFQRDLERLKEEERKRKLERKISLDEECKVKAAKKSLEKNLKLKEINEELEKIRLEEERLQQEIAKIQVGRKFVPNKHSTRYF